MSEPIDMFEEMAEQDDSAVIIDDVQAESTINHIMEIEGEYDRLIAVCTEQIKRYQDKINAYTTIKAEKTAFYYYRLKDYFNRIENKKTLKTKQVYKLPSGTITRKFGTRKIHYDEKELLDWLKDNGYDEYIKPVTKEGVSWQEFKEKLAFVEDQAVFGEDGVVVSGVSVEDTPDEFSFKLTV